MDNTESLLLKHQDFLVDYLKNDKGFSDKDIDEWMAVYKQLSISELSSLIYELVGSKVYHTEPVNMKTFIHDPYYLGAVFGESLFPLWDSMLQEIYPAPFCKTCNEVLLSCATRAGKTYSIAISMLYEIYLLLCMNNPASLLLGNPAETMVFAILSKDNSTAVSQGASLVFKGLSASPYFQERVPANLPISNVEKKGVPITDNILIKAGSSLATIIGTNLYAGCLDEANMPTTKIAIEKLVDVRMQIYTEMLDRHKASFDKAPALSGIIWMTSSPTDEGDVLGARINFVQEKGIPNVMIKDNIARWETRGTSATSTFDFFLGSDTKDPCLLEDVPDLVLTPEEIESRVIKVPRTLEYLSEFRNDPIHSIQNIAGRRTVAENSFFNSVGIFSEVFFKENHIFRADELNIPINTNMTLDDYLIDKDYFKHPDKPECYRYIHLDIASKKDRFGLASVYSDSVKYRSDEGEEITRRKYYIDFCLGIMSSGKDPVDILKVLEFVYGLKKLGYPIKVITTDNHQGELARQIISKRGIATEYLSVEKTKEPYYNLKNLILTKSLEGFVNPLLTRELHGLRESEKKIEKSKGYTDDLADALAGATFRCSQDPWFRRTDNDVKDLIINFKKAQRASRNVNLNPYNNPNNFKLW